MEKERNSTAAFVIVLSAIVIGSFWALSFGWQYYKVFKAEQSGKAELAQAEWNRQIIVRQAQAKKDAASLEAESEVIRAEGVAKANKIVAEGLGGPEGYLRYLYIHMLSEQDGKEIIYIPTEAGLPILEATRK